MEFPEGQNVETKAEEVDAIPSDSSTAYSIRLPDEIVQLVRGGGGGQIQEVHVTDDDGNVQEIAYTYSTGDGEHIPTLVTTSDLPKQDDPSFEFYDNARGKINFNILKECVSKHRADDANSSKIDNLSRWGLVTSEYNALTNQSKSRAVLMKRWSTKAPRRQEYKKDPLKREVANEEEDMKKSVLIKQLKAYDAIRIEAAQYERDARKLEMENALLENESLRKENEILDIQMESAKLELSFLQEKLQQ